MNNKNFDSRTIVLVPAHNEEGNIIQCIQEARSAFYGARVLVLDNASSDRTAELAVLQEAEVLPVRQKGKGYAVTAGVRFALEQGCDWIALHDADNEYSAEDLAELAIACQRVAPTAQELHVMGVGLRQVMLGRVLWRSILANGVARWALQFALRKRPPEDILTGSRVMSAPLAKAMFDEAGESPFRGFELETAVTRQALKKGAIIVSDRVRYVPRAAGEKKIKATDMFGILKAAFNG
jgi:glycosyltransferase involved in cell wall biosynthesis